MARQSRIMLDRALLFQIPTSDPPTVSSPDSKTPCVIIYGDISHFQPRNPHNAQIRGKHTLFDIESLTLVQKQESHLPWSLQEQAGCASPMETWQEIDYTMDQTMGGACSVLPQSWNFASKLGEPMRICMIGHRPKKR